MDKTSFLLLSMKVKTRCERISRLIVKISSTLQNKSPASWSADWYPGKVVRIQSYIVQVKWNSLTCRFVEQSRSLKLNTQFISQANFCVTFNRLERSHKMKRALKKIDLLVWITISSSMSSYRSLRPLDCCYQSLF